MHRPARPEKKYDVTRYDGREVIARAATAKQARLYKPQAYDYYISTCWGVLGYRAAGGRWVEHQDGWEGIGPVTLPLVRAIQLNPGDYLTPEEIAQITGIGSLVRNGVLIARVYAFRRAHEGNPDRFIQTRASGDYAIRWPKERTWLWIDRVRKFPTVAPNTKP